MNLFFISIPFILLAFGQMVLTAYTFISDSKTMPNNAECIKNKAKKTFKHWQMALILAYILSIAVAIFIVHSAPFPFAFTYYFSALLSTMLYLAKVGNPIRTGILWFPLMPYCWFWRKK